MEQTNGKIHQYFTVTDSTLIAWHICAVKRKCSTCLLWHLQGAFAWKLVAWL